MDYNTQEDNSQMKIPPNDQNAEVVFLGCMLFDAEGLFDGIRLLTEDDFYRPNHRTVFSAMVALNEENSHVDIITLSDILKKRNEYELVGGLEYLLKISASVNTSANIEVYAKIIEEKATLRRLIKISGDLQNSCFNGQDDIDDIINSAEKGIFDIVQSKKSDDFAEIKDLMTNVLNNIDELLKNRGQATGLRTGFKDFDRMTSGLQKADLILIAARPSMGKTAFALNILQHISIREQKSVAMFSLEMSKESLVNRMLSSYAKIDANRLRTGDLPTEDMDKISESVYPMSTAKLYIDDTPGISVNELRAKARKLKLEKGLDLIVIDYLQLMSGPKKSESRQQEVSDISRGLKAIARELEVPIIALSQLSRANEKRPDKKPMLSDIRDSGAIEQDADLVCFIHREEYYNKDIADEERGIAEIIIAKQRNGETGTIRLRWFGQYTQFADLAHNY